jgi:hypothetical protein
MPLNAQPVPIANFTALAVTAMTTPVLTGELGVGGRIRGLGAGSERTRGGRRAKLVINRPSGDGAIAVYGADLGDALMGKPLGNAYATAQTQTNAVTLTTAAIAFGGSATVNGGVAMLDTTATTAGQPATIAAGIPTNLHIVVANGNLLRCSASPAAGTATAAPEVTFTVTAGVITLYVGAVGSWTGLTPMPIGSEVVEHFVAAPVQVLAGASNLTAYVGVLSRTVLFVTATTAVTLGASVVTLDGMHE